jgi:site-specific DNA-methyltransferase (adenine-specific)
LLDLNKIYNYESVTFMREFVPDNFVDLTVTSPPYDDLRNYNGYIFNFEAVANELYRITKDGGVVVWVVGDKTKDGSETGTSFKQALYFKEIGFKLHDTMIYQKKSPPLTHKRYEQEFEYMFVFVKGKLKTFNPIMIPKKYMDKRSNKAFGRNQDNNHDMGFSSDKTERIKGNVWEYLVGGGKSTKDKIAFKHPAIFPEQLAADHILSWSNEGDLVFDPMCGSGTTCKMALLNNRKYIGVEISKEYCEIINERLHNCI